MQEFLNPLQIRELPGIGPKTAEVFYKKGIRKIKDLLKFSQAELKELMGKHGQSIYYSARGIDDEPIVEFRQAKSIGEQITLAANSLDVVYIYSVFEKMCASVFKKFLESEFSAFKTIAVTVRFADFQTQTTSKSFKEGIDRRAKKQFMVESLRLFLPYCDLRKNPRQKPIRLVGIRIEKVVL